MMHVVYGLEGLLLLLAGVEDMKKQEIHILYILGMGVTALCGCLIRENHSWYGTVGGLAIGLCMIAVAWMSDGQIGKGDGMVIAALGIMCGVRNTLGIVCFASLFMLVPAFIIVLRKRGKKNIRLPFLPALFLGYIMTLLLGDIQ